MTFRNDTAPLGFVYRWTDSSNGMYYVGSHKGLDTDRYIGSGKYFKYAYAKRPNAFIREVLYTGADYQEVEDLILKTLDVENDDKSYNLKAIAWGGAVTGTKRSEATRQKMSDNRMGMKFSDEHRANIAKALIGGCRNKKAMRDTRTGIVYPTIKECCEALGINRKSVSNAFTTFRKINVKSPIIYYLEYA